MKNKQGAMGTEEVLMQQTEKIKCEKPEMDIANETYELLFLYY